MKIKEYLNSDGWVRQELDQMEYFRSKSLLVRLKAVESMGETVSIIRGIFVWQGKATRRNCNKSIA